jgi:hypothetical protein
MTSTCFIVLLERDRLFRVLDLTCRRIAGLSQELPEAAGQVREENELALLKGTSGRSLTPFQTQPF